MRNKRLLPPELLQGKLLPQATELEESVLGSLMYDRKAILPVVEMGLLATDFYKDSHQQIFLAIMQLDMESKPVDMLTVMNQLRVNGTLDLAGGPVYLSDLVSKVASTANIEYHSRIIHQKSIQRQYIMSLDAQLRVAYDENVDVYQLIEQGLAFSDKLLDSGVSTDPRHASEVLDAVITEIENRKLAGITGVKTPIHRLNTLTGGWQKSDLIILAARPGVGKTALALQCAREAALFAAMTGKAVIFFSLEMSATQLLIRLIAEDTKIPFSRIRQGELTPHEMAHVKSRKEYYKKLPLIIDDTASLSIQKMKAKKKRVKAKYGAIELIVVDYIQLMTVSNEDKGGKNREQEVSYVSRNLKAIAKEDDIPVIALAQLSRSVETRGGEKKPLLSDLRESGSIEQDSDMVMFLYRPEYYGYMEDSQGRSNEGRATIIISKHRNGTTGEIDCMWDKDFMRFYDEGNYGSPPEGYNTNHTIETGNPF